jgi:VWFA-related protein
MEAPMTSVRTALLISLIPLVVLPLPAQQPPALGDTVPTIQTIARQVVLDVVVTDSRGRPVLGLKPSDLLVTEDGAPQSLASFTEHTDTSDTRLPPPLPPNTFADHAPLTGNGTITVILFDELSFVDAAYARYEVDKFMKTLQPGMPICIFKLDWYGLHLVQDFTTDPSTLRAAVDSKRNAPNLQPPRYMYQLNLRQNAMQALASYLSGFSGRKNLIWFNSGFAPQVGIGGPNGLFPDQQSFFDDPKGTIDVLTLSRVALYPVDARGLVVDARRGFEITVEDGELADVAGQTGGKAFYNTNGLKEAVVEVVDNGSKYYTLAYDPTNANWDGRFRTIKIKLVNNAIADAIAGSQPVQLKLPLHLEYRQGYLATPLPVSRPAAAGTRRLIAYSPKGDPDGPGAAIATPLQHAMAFSAITPFQILFQAHLLPQPTPQKLKRHAPAPKDNYLQPKWLHTQFRNYVVHYSVDTKDIAFTSPSIGSYHANIEFIAVVYDDFGEQVNSVVTTVPLDLGPNEYVHAMRSALGLDQTIAIPTHGNYFLRLGLHDLTSGHLGALEIPAESIKILASPNPKSAAKTSN